MLFSNLLGFRNSNSSSCVRFIHLCSGLCRQPLVWPRCGALAEGMDTWHLWATEKLRCQHLTMGDCYRRKFRSETSDNMDSWKAEVRRVRRDKIRRKKMQMREKVGKSRNTVFFQWFVAPVGRKVGSLKRRVRSQLARWEMKNCTPLWREAHFEVKMYKTHQLWKLRWWKSARRCGAKHISNSKCTKHTNLGPLLEVEMMKKCTPLWREAHFQVKMYKTPQLRTTFGSWDVEKVHAVVARSTFRSQKC